MLPGILNIDTHTGAAHESLILVISLFVLAFNFNFMAFHIVTKYSLIDVKLGSDEMRLCVNQSTISIDISISIDMEKKLLLL